MEKVNFQNIDIGLCVICGNPTIVGRITDSEECHEKFVKFCEEEFGDVKKVVDGTTDITYKVSTRDIIEKGLKWEDLVNYPLWNEGDIKNG